MSPSSMDSFDASALGAFIQSTADARGFESATGVLVFLGGFTTFGGTTLRKVAVYDPATGAYADNSIYGIEPFGATNFDPTCACVYHGILYLGDNQGRLWEWTDPADFFDGRWTLVYDPGGSGDKSITGMVVWNDQLIFAGLRNHPQAWDGATITEFQDPALSGESADLFFYEGLAVVNVGGDDRVAFSYAIGNDATAMQFFCGYYDGAVWDYTPATFGQTSGGYRRWNRDGDKFYFFHEIDTIGSGTAGTNQSSQVQRYDAQTHTLERWSIPNPPFTSGAIPRFDSNGAGEYDSSVAMIGGHLLVVGDQERFAADGSTFSACDNSVGLTPTTFDAGTGIEAVGGFLSVSAQIFTARPDKIFVGGDSAQLTQYGGGLVGGGTSYRLATFDGSTWAAWPEQPNANITAVELLDSTPAA